MKYAKALKQHVYRGKLRKVGDVYQIGKADLDMRLRTKEVERASNPNEEPFYQTTEMEAPRKKRTYTRKKKVSDE